MAVNANVSDGAKEIAEHAQQNKLQFPVLKDEKQVVADRFGASRTPEAVLLDAERMVRYHGRISDQFGFGYKRAAPTRSDLDVAIYEVLAGKEGAVPVAEVEGCEIARAAAPQGRRDRDVQQGCRPHPSKELPGSATGPGPGRGPMPLVTYDDTGPRGPALSAAWSRTAESPPWHADPHFGSFSNTRGLSVTEKQTLLDWIDQGCPAGESEGTAAGQGVHRGLAHRAARQGVHDAAGVQGAGHGRTARRRLPTLHCADQLRPGHVGASG